MSGFGAWAASIQGTAAIAGCMLVFGVIAGWLTATRPRGLSRRERRELADAAADRAAGQFRAWGSRGGTVMPHKPDPEAAARRTAMARRIHPVYRQRQAIEPPEVAHEWEPVHVGQALALVRDDLTDSAYTEDMAARMDRFLNDLLRVPYSADELWSGQ